MVGYFEGLDSKRGIGWCCADSFSLRDFLRLSTREKVPDHSWLSKTRSRLPHEVHEKAFGFVLKLVAERGLVKASVSASTARPWRRTRRCAASCGATTARPTEQSLSAWRRKAGPRRRTPRIWRVSTASAKARSCRTTTGRAPRTPRRKSRG
ncbi:transposase [Methylosinus sp. R-45379]|uniref:transposase n=1 Tax=Methylosinus sp. R-45379 TaxID=980563 RepID=UPI00352E4DD1